MMNLIKEYYQAVSTKDIDSLQKLLHPKLFGIRLYDENNISTINELLTYVLHNNIRIENIVETKSSEKTIYYTMNVITKEKAISVTAKATIEDHKIYHIYETVESNARRFLVTTSYDGTLFEGYQRQPLKRTVQGEIEKAISLAFNIEPFITIHSSGRTDKGVHAYKQVFHFDLLTTINADKIYKIIQTKLPRDIVLLNSKEVPKTFHSRYNIVWKEYIYKINTEFYDPTQRNYEWFVKNIDEEKLKVDAKKIEGMHDFQSFTTKTDKNTKRFIHFLKIERKCNQLIIIIRGNGFLRYMVRYIVQALIDSNLGRSTYTIEELLQRKDPSLLGKMAPPGGLYLNDVCYDEI
jgi:tRNA pseudouridine38-40 synthase